MSYSPPHHHHSNNHNHHNNHHHKLPKRIILVRHGESQGNTDPQAYSTTPDHKIPLTSTGVAQSRRVGVTIRRLLDSSSPLSPSSSSRITTLWRVYFYVSPYERARSTLREIGRSFSKNRIIGVREECRIREQDFGNFQVAGRMKVIKQTRVKFGRFFYRFPEGESAADVYDRVSSFMESLWRDIDLNRLHPEPGHDLNLIIVTHGLSSRVFLMKWFKWTVEQFELLKNPENCEYRVMELGEGGDYSLAINHTEDELREWGLSPEMIADQKWRVHARRGGWNEKCPWYLDAFFDHLQSEDNSAEECSDHSEDGSPLCPDHSRCDNVEDSCDNGVEDDEDDELESIVSER
ncbi:hypothetical protein RND81_04G011000 [Saponaria officinalis]|uniref:Phosphoglycerate mutase-like protein AT74H n=1 Tax=Saponaria officinalis TaxID=3572 RepID=A0AAW1LJ38_SAPOF